MTVQGGGERDERAWRRRRWWAGLALALGLLAWWTQGRDDGRSPLAGEAAVPSSTGAAAAASGAGASPGVNDPWALLRRAEAVEQKPVPVEIQKALAWLEPKNDAAWCQHAEAQAAKLAAAKPDDDAEEPSTDALTLALARREALQRWIQVLRQRGDGRSLAGADYLQAVDSVDGDLYLRSEALQQRAASSQDGRVLALAAQLSCEPAQAGCQALVSRWLQLEPRNESALNWQLTLLPHGSPEQLSLLTRLAEAQADTESRQTWATLFQSLPRTASAGLRQEGEQGVLMAVFWAGNGPMVPNWASLCRQDQRPATVAVCVKLAERIWQSPGGSLMDKMLALAVGKKQKDAGPEWAQRQQTFKAVQAAGTRLQNENLATYFSASTCTGLAARSDFQQRLVRDGEWQVFSQFAAQSPGPPEPAQPVLRSPAAIPLIDK